MQNDDGAVAHTSEFERESSEFDYEGLNSTGAPCEAFAANDHSEKKLHGALHGVELVFLSLF